MLSKNPIHCIIVPAPEFQEFKIKIDVRRSQNNSTAPRTIFLHAVDPVLFPASHIVLQALLDITSKHCKGQPKKKNEKKEIDVWRDTKGSAVNESANFIYMV